MPREAVRLLQTMLEDVPGGGKGILLMVETPVILMVLANEVEPILSVIRADCLPPPVSR